MRLKKLNYKEFSKDGENNYWEIKDLILGKLNLLVGKNATGKTRTVNVISGLAEMITAQAPLTNGEFNIEFITEADKTLIYELKQVNGKVVYEKILLDGKEMLDRNEAKTKIVSTINGESEIEPPADKLVLHV